MLTLCAQLRTDLPCWATYTNSIVIRPSNGEINCHDFLGSQSNRSSSMTDRRTVAVPVYLFHFWLYFQLLRGDFVDQAFVLNDYPDWDHRSTAFRQLFPTFKRCMFPVS